MPVDHYKPLGHHFTGNNDNAVSRPKFESEAHEQSRNNVRPMSPHAVFLYSEYILRLYLGPNIGCLAIFPLRENAREVYKN